MLRSGPQKLPFFTFLLVIIQISTFSISNQLPESTMKFSTTLIDLFMALGLTTAFPVKTHVNGTTTADLHNTTAVEGCIDCDCPLWTICASTVNLDSRDTAFNVSAPAPVSPNWNSPSAWFMKRAHAAASSLAIGARSV